MISAGSAPALDRTGLAQILLAVVADDINRAKAIGTSSGSSFDSSLLENELEDGHLSIVIFMQAPTLPTVSADPGMSADAAACLQALIANYITQGRIDLLNSEAASGDANGYLTTIDAIWNVANNANAGDQNSFYAKCVAAGCTENNVAAAATAVVGSVLAACEYARLVAQGNPPQAPFNNSSSATQLVLSG